MANSLKNYEKKYNQLEDIVRELDNENMPLDKLIDNYQKALKLVKECSEILNSADDEIKQLIAENTVTDYL